MKLLLDTHVLLWCLSAPTELRTAGILGVSGCAMLDALILEIRAKITS